MMKLFQSRNSWIGGIFEFKDLTFVGSDNSGERVQYVARSQEDIEANVAFILSRLVDRSLPE